jgi:hypothetical protein
MNAPSLPPVDVGRALHARLLAGDLLAHRELCLTFIPPLVAILSRSFPRDPELVQTAVHDAIVTYVNNPAAYAPDLLDLGRYLRMSAHRDLLNLLRLEARQTRLLNPLPDVELADDHGNNVLDAALIKEEAEAARLTVQRLRGDLNERDRAVLDLILEEERRTTVYATVLGVADQPENEQARIVKRAKDRVKKRIERGGENHD